MRSVLVLVILLALACSCGGSSQDQAAKLVNNSDQPCADKVALALNSSKPVFGAWECFDDYLKGIWAFSPVYPAPAVSSDEGIALWVNSAKYMETVKFVGHRGLYDAPPFNTAHLLYRMEGHPNSNHIVGYTDIGIGPDSSLVHSEDIVYCQPEGDLKCTGLPT